MGRAPEGTPTPTGGLPPPLGLGHQPPPPCASLDLQALRAHIEEFSLDLRTQLLEDDAWSQKDLATFSVSRYEASTGLRANVLWRAGDEFKRVAREGNPTKSRDAAHIVLSAIANAPHRERLELPGVGYFEVVDKAARFDFDENGVPIDKSAVGGVRVFFFVCDPALKAKLAASPEYERPAVRPSWERAACPWRLP
ncbi:MAG: hypothetical protein KC912_12190 [Proteobacteria bacterium]|nr:hypothetical protein [Pseudomonadota bacterium]